MKSFISFVLIIIISISFQFCDNNKKSNNDIEKKETETTLIEKPIKLSEPIQLYETDIEEINTNIRAYYDAHTNKEYYQTYLKFFIGDSIKKLAARTNFGGIRIAKGLYPDTTPTTFSQNFIIQFLGKNGWTEINAQNYLASDKKNICQSSCLDTDILKGTEPTEFTSFKLDLCILYTGYYRNLSDTKKDTINSFIIPEVIVRKLYQDGITYIKVYNALRNKKIIYYVLSYRNDALVIPSSFSLDDTYTCPNFCDGTEYTFSQNIKSKI